jgi:hypothetical protein
MAKPLIAILCVGLASAAPWPFSMWRSAASSRVSQMQTETNESPAELPKFYHTTEQLHGSVLRLLDSCHGLLVQNVKHKEFELQVARYLHPDEKAQFKTMVVAGEHAREMIGSEVALNFLKALCGQGDPRGLPDLAEAKKGTEFLVVINANPIGRSKVEKGDFCTRTNGNHVDINRNFDYEYQDVDRNNADTNPGVTAFDQSEARLLKYLMETFHPHAYLDLHSGFRGMFFPNGVAEDPELTSQLLHLCAPVDESACKCPLGVANKEVGYHTAGSALDYGFSKVKIPFAMAVEVYLDEDEAAEISELENRWNSQKTDLLKPIAKRSDFMVKGIPKNSKLQMSFIQTKSKDTSEMSPEGCLKYFNPINRISFRKTLTTWSNAIASLSIKSREIDSNAAGQASEFEARKKHKKNKKNRDFKSRNKGLAFHQITKEEEEGESPMWIAAKVLGLLFIVYIAIKYYKVKQSKAAEAAPFAPQTSPVQVSD